MRCSGCGHTSRPGARFCEECGLKLAATCPACTAAVAPGARFCGSCGQPFTHASSPTPPRAQLESIASSRTALEGERKQVTVLFADLRGSLELIADRDPEEARRLLDPVLDRLMDAVHHYGGTVNQVMGDGIMALFGAPVSYEDHAVRACCAAVEMQDSLTRDAAAHRSLDLKIRVGLNSGEVVVRSIGTGFHVDYSAIGRTTHLAARMEQLAEPGTTLLTEMTRRLAGACVETAPLGPLAVKGLAEPIEVHRLLTARPFRVRLEAARGRPLTPFIGREVEMAQLAELAGRAESGQGQVVAVVGEPGVGKSRLVAEFSRRHLPTAWLTMEAGAAFEGGATAYLPIAALLHGYFQIHDGEPPHQIADRVTSRLQDLDATLLSARTPILTVLGVPVEDPRWNGLDPLQRRRHALDAVAQLLLRHSAHQCLCLVIEDLHWIDAETQEFLDEFVSRIPRARILLVVTYRPETRHGWASHSHYTQLPIAPLPYRTARQFLESLLGSHPTLSALTARLIEWTEGNPFFLEECVSALVQTGELVGRPGAYERKDGPASLQVPPTVQAVIAARIDRLAEEDKRLLQCAAAIGPQVPLALLEAVDEGDAEDLRRRLNNLRRGEFLHESPHAPGAQVTFKHMLTLEVAYGSLVGARRRALDLRIVEAIERLHADHLLDHIDRLCHHSVRGELWERAVRYSRLAGTRALARSAHRAAIQHLERALDALTHQPATPATMAEAIDIRLELRNALAPLGEYQRTVDCLRGAEALAKSAGDERRLALVSCYLANHLHLNGSLRLAADEGGRALDIAVGLRDLPLQVMASAYLGFIHYTQGDYRRAIELARRNVTMLRGGLRFERLGMTSLPAVYSCTALGWSLAEVGEFAEAAAVGHEALEIAEAAEHPFSLIWACVALGTVLLRQGELSPAVVLLERALAVCRDGEIPGQYSMVAVPLASAYAHAGQAPHAIEILDEAARQAARIGDPLGHWVRTGALAEAHLLGGRPREALPLARRYLAQRRRIQAEGYTGWALTLVADILAALDPQEGQEAESCYRDALAIGEKLGARPLTARCRLGLGSLYGRGGRAEDGVAELRAALALFRSMDMTFWIRRTERELLGTG